MSNTELGRELDALSGLDGESAKVYMASFDDYVWQMATDRALGIDTVPPILAKHLLMTMAVIHAYGISAGQVDTACNLVIERAARGAYDEA